MEKPFAAAFAQDYFISYWAMTYKTLSQLVSDANGPQRPAKVPEGI
jgi:hypothetical protein